MVPHTKCLNARTDPFFGRWGGPGWGSGRWVPERYLRPGDFDVNDPNLRPVDPRDWCYYGHDKCIWKCYSDQKNNSECVDEKAVNRCVRQCDRELGNCLGKLPWGDLPKGDTRWRTWPAPVEGWLFWSLIPFYSHGGWNDWSNF
jgi:hypothetical protein